MVWVVLASENEAEQAMFAFLDRPMVCFGGYYNVYFL